LLAGFSEISLSLSFRTVTKSVARKAGGTADLLSDEVDDKTKKKVRKAV